MKSEASRSVTSWALWGSLWTNSIVKPSLPLLLTDVARRIVSTATVLDVTSGNGRVSSSTLSRRVRLRISGRMVSRLRPRSCVATLGTKESGTFSDSMRISVEDLYFLGRTKRAAIDNRRMPAHGTSTMSGWRSGACRKCWNLPQLNDSSSASSR